MAAKFPERLTKNDVGKIADAFRKLGFDVVVRPSLIRVYEHDPPTATSRTTRLVASFAWRQRTSSGDPLPGHWVFTLVTAPVHSVKDLETAVDETRRVRRRIPLVSAAWLAFKDAKSVARWATYRGAVAALFLRGFDR